MRLTDAERSALEELRRVVPGPRGVGPWLVWNAIGRQPALPWVVPAPAPSAVVPGPTSHAVVPVRSRVVLDLCAGTGAWSEPYERAGYAVRRVTLPELDVRTFEPAGDVWGVLAAPPCTEFSLAKNGQARDFETGLETVVACLRVIALCRPKWWALENPTGYLSRFLGTPRDVWEPCDFGDPWTKRTAIWGDFRIPTRGPFVNPIASKLDLESSREERARTPSGFARAFFEANP